MFNGQIAYLLAKVPEVNEILRPMLIISGFIALTNGVVPTLNTILRCMDKNNLLTLITFVLEMVYLLTSTYLILFVFELAGYMVILNLFLTFSVHFVVCWVIIYLFDWNELEIKF